LIKKPREAANKTKKRASRLIAKDILHIQSDIRFFFQSFQNILIPREALQFSKEINPKVENIF
jgi:hypothetical protein